MASSVGAVSAASVSRGVSVSNNEYRVVLALLPTGIAAPNTVFLQCDVSESSYRLEEFRRSSEQVGLHNETATVGPYQMTHVWMARKK